MTETMSPVLIIEDEEPLLESYLLKLEDEAYQLEPALSLKEAQHKLSNKEYHVVLTDIKLRTAERGGLTLLEEIKKQYPATQVILFSGIAGTDEARQARRLSADGFLTKPLDYDNVRQVIRNCIAVRNQLIEIYPSGGDFATPDPLIYYSGPMKEMVKRATKLATRPDNILIVGEPGTGKGLIAEGIHFGSTRPTFELINCGSLSERSLGRILFGYFDEKSEVYHGGVLQRLQGGTLVLDRVSGLSLPLQRLLLQALLNKKVKSTNEKIPEYVVDLRIIAIDDTDLQSEVNQGLFLPDLYNIIAATRLQVPPLRDRTDEDFKDVLPLAEYFIEKYTQGITEAPRLMAESSYILESYPFPQNVSELQTVIRMAIGKAEGNGSIEPEHLPLRLQRYGIRIGFDTVDQQDPVLCPHGSFHCDKVDKIAKAHQRSKGVYLRVSDSVYEIVSDLVRKHGLEAFPPEKIPNALTAMCTHCFPIQSSKFAIVDVSNSDSQIFYEVGLLHALGIPTLLLMHRDVNILLTVQNSIIQKFDSDEDIFNIVEFWLKEFI